MDNEEMISISVEKYEELMEDSRMFAALRASGVDDWEGYEYALELADKWDEWDRE